MRNLPWIQIGVLVLMLGVGWLDYAHGPEIMRRLRFGTTPTPDVAAAITQADAAAIEARAHGAEALRNQVLAQEAAQGAREAAEKAREHVAGYASQAPMKENGATVFGYEGQVNRNGSPEGLEVVMFDQGGRYEGGWKDALPDGYGVMTYSGGRVHAGKWEKGINTGQGITITNGVTWQGDLPGGGAAKADALYRGVMLCAADETCLSRAGSFQISAAGAFALDGPAVVVMRDGRQIKGFWRNDVQQGYGAVLDAQGGLLEQGNYNNGQL